jgi:hypothetical protein
MNEPTAIRLAALAAALCFACAGCSKAPPERAAPAPAPAKSSTGADRLLPGELAEGTERAKGLVLPRGLWVERRFNDSVAARGRIRPEPIANYVRQRVEGGTVEIGVARTVFDNAHVKGQPAERRVRVEVALDDTGTVVMIRDVTPPALDLNLPQDELWRRTGIGKGGKILDPAQTQ